MVVRTPHPLVAFGMLAFLLPAGACAGSPGAPPPAQDASPSPSTSTDDDAGVPTLADLDELVITVTTTGGIAGMDWRVTLEGATGEIRVEQCGNNCPWPNGRSRAVPPAAVEEIVGAFVEAGVTRRAETDYGICAGCADQFHHVIEYRDGDGTHHVEGDGPNFPRDLYTAVHRLIWEADPTSSAP